MATAAEGRLSEDYQPALNAVSSNPEKQSEIVSSNFAAERSHQNSKIAYELAKAASQACVLINGGAATALLAFLSKESGRGILWTAPYCLASYAIGVIFGVMMGYAMFQTNLNWNIYWQAQALNQPENLRANTGGQRWRAVAHGCFIASITCFLGASIALAISFRGAIPF